MYYIQIGYNTSRGDNPQGRRSRPCGLSRNCFAILSILVGRFFFIVLKFFAKNLKAF